MPSKQLMGAWIFFDICLLAAGVISILFSIIWSQPNLLINLVFSKADLTGEFRVASATSVITSRHHHQYPHPPIFTLCFVLTHITAAGLVLGIFLITTFVVSVGAIVQKNHVTIGLVILNWMLLADGIVVVVIGSFIWFFSLRERANFHKVFSQQSDATKIAVQDKLKCCGYFNSSDLVVIGGNFCQNETFVTVTNNATGNFCVGPITKFADVSLNNAFTTIYGFVAIVIGLFLASLCVIKKVRHSLIFGRVINIDAWHQRDEEERFKRIDAKRGGRGFV
jgi:hypothetical protein